MLLRPKFSLLLGRQRRVPLRPVAGFSTREQREPHNGSAVCVRPQDLALFRDARPRSAAGLAGVAADVEPMTGEALVCWSRTC